MMMIQVKMMTMMMCDAGSQRLDQMLSMLLSTNMFIGGILGCLLDNMIPGEH